MIPIVQVKNAEKDARFAVAAKLSIAAELMSDDFNVKNLMQNMI